MAVGHAERGLPVGFLLFDTDRFWEEQQRGEGARCAGAPPAPATLQLGAGRPGRMALSSAGTEVSWFHKKEAKRVCFSNPAERKAERGCDRCL